MLFQLVLTKFFKSELLSYLPKVGHVIKSCKEPIQIFAKKHKTVFGFINFSKKHTLRNTANQCLQYLGTVTVRLSEAKRRVEAKYIFKVIQFNA